MANLRGGLMARPGEGIYQRDTNLGAVLAAFIAEHECCAELAASSTTKWSR